jgi:hypothetical protein
MLSLITKIQISIVVYGAYHSGFLAYIAKHLSGTWQC